MLPVPNARRVTFTLDLPRVTQSVAVPVAALIGKTPVPARAPAANPAFKKSRLELWCMVPPWGGCYHESGGQPKGAGAWCVCISGDCSKTQCDRAGRARVCEMIYCN